MSQTIPFVIASILLVPGIVMAAIPVLPALSYMFVIAFIYALYGGFHVLQGGELGILAVVLVVSIILDQMSGVLGAKYGGAHAKSLVWGMVGAFVGTLFFPLLGGFIGLFIAVLGSELYYKRSNQHALKAAGSALVGKVVGVLINIGLALLFTGLFLYFAW